VTRPFFISLLLFLSVAAAAQSKIDVLHYKYEIELSDQNDTIIGNAGITFVAKGDVKNLIVDLTNINKGKGMNVISASSAYLSRKSNDWTHNDNKLNIPIHWNLHYGDTATIYIKYKGIPSDGLIISKNKYGHRTFFADNWPNRAHSWIPCVDDPSDKASVEFIVTAPFHYQVISNGIQTEEKNLPGNKKLTHYKEEVPLPTKVMVIGVADFAVDKVGVVNNVPVYSWVFPENKKEGFNDYAIAKDILAFYINYIGPYPYKKLANVQSKTRFGGMENAGAIFYSENSVTGDRREESLLAHEIAHQWFGDMATEKNFAHLWLSEGFATYLAHIYFEEKYGKERFNNDMKAERDEVIDFVKTFHKPVVDSVSPFMDLLNANNYQKGSWVLHMLRRQLGDSVFKKCIRKYYETYAGKNADTRDLQKVFESVSGKSLENFFTQWLYTPENPKLDIKWKYDVKLSKLMITVNQLQASVFSFPLVIRLGKKRMSAPQLLNLNISKKTETFTFPVADGVAMINADPFTSLLAEISVSEMK
jgi:aminopeptidase N